jgi:hypothetical protein
LARNIARPNESIVSSDDLNFAVQMTIDRVVFLRLAEDRGLEPYQQLLKLCERPEVYHRFVRDLCRKADKKYNSGLFHFQRESGVREEPDKITPALSIPDAVFAPILRSLYYEHGSPYDFGRIPVAILGTVYERFLGKVIRLTAGHQAKIEEKVEVRKAGGVYYTPAYIVDYIVKQTLEPMVAGGSPSHLAGEKRQSPFRVLDMACGSGSFLLGAYQFLLDNCLDWYTAHRPESFKQAVYLDRRSGHWRLKIQGKEADSDNAYFWRRDRSSSGRSFETPLLLKVLEGETDHSLAMSEFRFNERALPNLSDNIKFGNSLIGPDYFSGKMFPDRDKLSQIKPFSWLQGFPDAISTGGFDCIIGNPPYLSVDDTWGRRDPRLEALKVLYPDVYNDKSDVLFYFLAKSVELCKGRSGFIVSRAFTEAYKANRSRSFLVSKTNIEQLVDFRNLHVFPGVGITTCLLLLSSSRAEKQIDVYRLRRSELPSYSLAKHLANARWFEKITIARTTLGGSPWTPVSSESMILNERIDRVGEALSKILLPGQGMQTGRNDVFGKRTRNEIKNCALKPGMYYNRASNSDIQRYFIRDRSEYIVYVESVKKFDGLPIGLREHLSAQAKEPKSRAAYRR